MLNSLSTPRISRRTDRQTDTQTDTQQDTWEEASRLQRPIGRYFCFVGGMQRRVGLAACWHCLLYVRNWRRTMNRQQHTISTCESHSVCSSQRAFLCSVSWNTNTASKLGFSNNNNNNNNPICKAPECQKTSVALAAFHTVPNHTCLCLPSRSWYSFTDPGGMEGWVGLGAELAQNSDIPICDYHCTPTRNCRREANWTSVQSRTKRRGIRLNWTYVRLADKRR